MKFVVVPLSAVVLSASLGAQVVTDHTMLLREPLQEFAEFGRSVDIEGDRLLVGVPSDAAAAMKGGAAYVYERSGSAWSQVQQILPPDADPTYHRFGIAAALEGDRAYVMSEYDDAPIGAGSVNVFLRQPDGSWTLEAELYPTIDVSYLDERIAVHGNLCAFGRARSQSGGTLDRGVVFVYERDVAGVWSSVATLTLPEDVPYEGFGCSLGLSGEWLAVGARWADAPLHRQGAVYLYRRAADGKWDLHQKLRANDASAEDAFGASLALDDERLVVWAYEHDGGSPDAGAVYVFDFDGTSWREAARLLPPADGSMSFEGYLAAQGDRLAFISDDTGQYGLSEIWIYDRQTNGTWQRTLRCVPKTGVDGAWPIALDGDRIALGNHSYEDFENPNGSQYLLGAVHVFEVGSLAASTNEFSLAAGGYPLAELTETLVGVGAGNVQRQGVGVVVDQDLLAVGLAWSSGVLSPWQILFFDRGPTGWVEAPPLVAPVASPGENARPSFDLEGNRLAVGLPYSENAAGQTVGEVAIHDRDPSGAWIQSASIMPAGVPPLFGVGSGIKLEDGVLFVPVYWDTTVHGVESGSVRVYEELATGWAQTQVLTPSTGAPSMRFGYGVVADGDTLLVRSYPLASTSVTPRVWVFDRQPDGTWVETGQILPPTPNEWFGFDFSGDCCALTEQGVGVHMYERSGSSWSSVQTLVGVDLSTTTTPDYNDLYFPRSVSLRGDRLLLGGYFPSDEPYLLRAVPGVSLFERDSAGTWVLTTALCSDRHHLPYSGLGESLAQDDSELFLGNSKFSFEVPPYNTGGVGVVSLQSLSPSEPLPAVRQTLFLRAGLEHAGETFLLATSRSGTSPGTPLPGTSLVLPLVYDDFVLQTISGTGYVTPHFGVLDAFGAAQAEVVLPAGLDPSLAGAVLHHAYVTFSNQPPFGIEFVSRAIDLIAMP